jgi:hypothetical protein
MIHPAPVLAVDAFNRNKKRPSRIGDERNVAGNAPAIPPRLSWRVSSFPLVKCPVTVAVSGAEEKK